MGWRMRLVFTLIVYFAGFATAVYLIAPTPETGTRASTGRNSASSGLKSDELMRSLQAGMGKCVDLGKDMAARAAELIKNKLEEEKRKSSK